MDATMEDVFGPVIHSYSRADALEDGVLVDVSDVAKEAGFKWPVAVTSELWADINTFTKGSGQDVSGRLWDVVYMARMAAKGTIPVQGNQTNAVYQMTLKMGKKSRYQVRMVSGPGDNMEPVITLMQPHQD